MRGYNAMLEKIEPEKIICFGTPFSETDENLITKFETVSKAV